MPPRSLSATVRASLGGAALAALIAFAAEACRERQPSCYEGDYQACSCAQGAAGAAAFGYARCNTESDAFDPCVCDGATPGLDAGAETDATGAD